MKPAELAVRLESVQVSYQGRAALDIPKLEIHPGEQVVVMGPSGYRTCGEPKAKCNIMCSQPRLLSPLSD